MSEHPAEARLEVDIERRIHPGLTLRARFALGPECGVVFGPSGAGKSSLLRLIAGLDRPDKGYIRLDQVVLFDDSRQLRVPLRSRRIGMIFQEDLLFPHLDVFHNVAFGLADQPRPAARVRVSEVAELCGISGLLDRPVSALSGGERQRVGLARALAPRPRLLLCDEPVSALDLESRFLLLERLAAIQRFESIPVLYVTHAPAEAVAVGSRLFLLREGRITAEGPPLEVLTTHARGHEAFGELRNVFAGRVVSHLDGGSATCLELDGGPPLIVPYQQVPVGCRLSVAIRAEEVLLARGPIAGGLSARNIVPGTVAQILPHQREAEVIVRTGDLDWMVSVVEPALAALDLHPGAKVHLVVKARSCHVLGVFSPQAGAGAAAAPTASSEKQVRS